MTVIKSETTKKINDSGVEIVVVEEHSIENYKDFEILFIERGLYKSYLLDFEYNVINSLEPVSEAADGEGNYHVYDTFVESVTIIGDRTLVKGYVVFTGSVTRTTVLDGNKNSYCFKTNIAAIQHFSQEDLSEVFNKIWELHRTRNLRMENLSDSYKSYKSANKRLSKSLVMFLLVMFISCIAIFMKGIDSLDMVETIMFGVIFVLGLLPVTINAKDGFKVKRELEENHKLTMECMDKKVFQEMWVKCYFETYGKNGYPKNIK